MDNMKFIALVIEYLKGLNLEVERQEIKRGYWRLAKKRYGINIGLDNQVYQISEYLILNRIAQKIT